MRAGFDIGFDIGIACGRFGLAITFSSGSGLSTGAGSSSGRRRLGLTMGFWIGVGFGRFDLSTVLGVGSGFVAFSVGGLMRVGFGGGFEIVVAFVRLGVGAVSYSASESESESNG